MERAHSALPPTPLHRLLALEEREISRSLADFGVVTPDNIGDPGRAVQGGRRGFVQILVYNPHDGKLYAEFSKSPLLAALNLIDGETERERAWAGDGR